MKLFSSSVFKFSAMVLLVGLIGVYNGGLSWELWFEQAKFYVGIYAGKEGVRYGSEAYKEHKNV